MVNAFGGIANALAQVQTGTGRNIFLLRHDRRNEHPIANDDRAAPTLPGHVNDPVHVGGRVPNGRQIRVIAGNPGRIAATETREVFRSSHDRSGNRQNETEEKPKTLRTDHEPSRPLISGEHAAMHR